MKNKADYSKYECPFSHLEKECGHELKGPEGYENTYGVWCSCGFHGPVFYLEPEELNLKLKEESGNECDHNWQTVFYEDSVIIGRYCPICNKMESD